MRVERLAKEYRVEPVWLPFELHPGLPAEGVPREQLFPDIDSPRNDDYKRHLKETAAASSIVIRRNPVIANSQKAFEAAEWAREQGKVREFGEALFRAYFTDARNIGLPDVLVAIAREEGLDGDGLAAALADGRFAGRVREASDWGKQAGVRSTPTFIFNGRYALIGAQPYEAFEQVMARLGAARTGNGGPGSS